MQIISNVSYYLGRLDKENSTNINFYFVTFSGYFLNKVLQIARLAQLFQDNTTKRWKLFLVCNGKRVLISISVIWEFHRSFSPQQLHLQIFFFFHSVTTTDILYDVPYAHSAIRNTHKSDESHIEDRSRASSNGD